MPLRLSRTNGLATHCPQCLFVNGARGAVRPGIIRQGQKLGHGGKQHDKRQEPRMTTDEWQIDTPIEDLIIGIEWDAMVEQSEKD